ncbi:MAG: hypothetical protein IJ049_04225, partial [Oscillospiraceae bacterium]|nr:hypothetical protein [Oscillospiraceae bacterium]
EEPEEPEEPEKPNEPGEPEEPTNPTEPSKPAKPAKPSKPAKTPKPSGNTVKTGDDTLVLTWSVAMLTAATMLAAVLKGCFRKRRDE